jgi:hypothetical protein
MAPFKHQNGNENDLTNQSKGYDLWYYEQRENGRLYFRLAPFGWALLIIPALLAIVAMIILFFYNTNRPMPKTDVTIKPPPVSSDTLNNLEIKPAPPQPAPRRVNNRMNFNAINPLSSPQRNRNINGQ